MKNMIDSLERRCLLSADLPAGLFADAGATYELVVEGVPGDPLELTHIEWGVTMGAGHGAATSDPLYVMLPSGMHSPGLLQLITTNQDIDELTVTAFHGDGTLREVWALADTPASETSQTQARLVGYQQVLIAGVLHDALTFDISYANLTYQLGKENFSFEWNFWTNSGQTPPPLVHTHYMSTTAEVPATMETGRGQQPVGAYSFAVHTNQSAPVTDGIHHETVHGAEMIPLLARDIRGETIKEVVYHQRDEAGLPLLHQRFADVGTFHFGFHDSTLDDAAAINSWSRMPSRFQTIAYEVKNHEIVSTHVAGWNFQTNTAWDAGSVTAWVAPVPELISSPLPDPVFRFTRPVTGLSLSDFIFEGFTASGLSLSTADGGRSWTLNGVADKQVADGEYAIKLFAQESGVHSSGDPLISSAGMHWTLDTTAPAPTAASFEFLSGQALALAFSEDVGQSLSVLDISLQNLTNGTTIPSGAMALVYDAASNSATVTFPGLARGILPDGNYRARIEAQSVTDAAGNPLTADLTLDFFVLAGDTDRDRDVDFFDFLKLRSNYGTSGKLFSDGDFDYDGEVDFFDFLILRGNYGSSLAPHVGGSLFDDGPGSRNRGGTFRG